MKFLKTLFVTKKAVAAFSAQFTENEVIAVIKQLREVKSEILLCVMPGVSITFESSLFISNLLSEFNHDQKLGIVFGEGKGHAFFRADYFRNVISKHRNNIVDSASLARSFLAEGYSIKKVRYVSFETDYL